MQRGYGIGLTVVLILIAVGVFAAAKPISPSLTHHVKFPLTIAKTTGNN